MHKSCVARLVVPTDLDYLMNSQLSVIFLFSHTSGEGDYVSSTCGEARFYQVIMIMAVLTPA